MTFTLKATPRPILRRRSQLRAALSRLASHLDRAGKPTAPITLNCSYVELCKLGLPAYQSGSFLYQSHPVTTAGRGV